MACPYPLPAAPCYWFTVNGLLLVSVPVGVVTTTLPVVVPLKPKAGLNGPPLPLLGRYGAKFVGQGRIQLRILLPAHLKLGR